MSASAIHRAAITTKKKQLATERLQLRTPATFSKSVAAPVDISKLGCTYLNFLDPRTKINGASVYDRDVLLSLIWTVVQQRVTISRRTLTTRTVAHQDVMWGV